MRNAVISSDHDAGDGAEAGSDHEGGRNDAIDVDAHQARDLRILRRRAHGDTEAQSTDVANVLRELGIEPEDPRLVEVWNKIDLVGADGRDGVENLAQRQPAA